MFILRSLCDSWYDHVSPFKLSLTVIIRKRLGEQGPLEIFALRNSTPRRIAEKPKRTRVPPRRAIAAKWARSRKAIVAYHSCARARTRTYLTNTHARSSPVGSIVKERCGWQEWKAHARASGSSARATGPLARAHEHARAALTRTHAHIRAHITHTHTCISGCGSTHV